MKITIKEIKRIVRAALFVAGEPVSLDRLLQLFEEHERPNKAELKKLIQDLQIEMREDVIELREVASGYRYQVRAEWAPWIRRLWDEKPPRYSRALLETLSLIAYRQPITRAEIEEVRGVSVSTSIMKTLQEREWVRIVGHRDVPGKPALYATTKAFLDYFSLKNLEELPSLHEIKDFEQVSLNLELDEDQTPQESEAPVEEVLVD